MLDEKLVSCLDEYTGREGFRDTREEDGKKRIRWFVRDTDARTIVLELNEDTHVFVVRIPSLANKCPCSEISFVTSQIREVLCECLDERHRKFYLLPAAQYTVIQFVLLDGTSYKIIFFNDEMKMENWDLEILRTRCDLTMDEIAARCGQKNFQTYQQYETGKRKIRNMKLRTAYKYASVFHISIDTLYRLTEGSLKTK